MAHFTQRLYISYLFFVLAIKTNMICRQMNPDPNEADYFQLAFDVAVNPQNYYEEKDAQIYQQNLESSVVQIFNLPQKHQNLSTSKFSFNVYKFPNNDFVKQQKKKQIEIQLRYMIFFRKSFEFKHLSDDGCRIVKDSQNEYIILKFPGERTQVNQWFSAMRNQDKIITLFDLSSQQKSNLDIRQQLKYNPFFGMDISLQFLIAVAKMHDKKLMHLNLKPFNLKLLNRYCLALDNFENTFYNKEDSQINKQGFSPENPYNGKNLINQNEDQFQYTDDLHSAGLVIYQICVFQTFDNEQLLDQIKSNFTKINCHEDQQLFCQQQKQWCRQIVHSLLLSNGRINGEDIQNFDGKQIQNNLTNGKDAVIKLLKIIIQMKSIYPEEFQQYYQTKIQYLQDNNQLSDSSIQFKDKLKYQTQIIISIVLNMDIDDDGTNNIEENINQYFQKKITSNLEESIDLNNEDSVNHYIDQNLYALLDDNEIDHKIVDNIFQILPLNLSLLDPNTLFKIQAQEDISENCIEKDLTIQCIDELFEKNLSQQQINDQPLDIVPVYQKEDYEFINLITQMDAKINGGGYDLDFNFSPQIASNEKSTFNLDYLLI